jgi:hypothetical protein
MGCHPLRRLTWYFAEILTKKSSGLRLLYQKFRQRLTSGTHQQPMRMYWGRTPLQTIQLTSTDSFSEFSGGKERQQLDIRSSKFRIPHAKQVADGPLQKVIPTRSKVYYTYYISIHLLEIHHERCFLLPSTSIKPGSDAPNSDWKGSPSRLQEAKFFSCHNCHNTTARWLRGWPLRRHLRPLCRICHVPQGGRHGVRLVQLRAPRLGCPDLVYPMFWGSCVLLKLVFDFRFSWWCPHVQHHLSHEASWQILATL